MIELWKIAGGFGVLLIILYVPMVTHPAGALRFIKSFPRNVVAARILAAIDLVWAGWLVYEMPLGRLERFDWALYALVPGTYLLVIFLMEDLLAARALGGLFLILPAYLLRSSFMCHSPWKLVIVVISYIMVIKGMVLVLSPYQLRRASERFLSDEKACRTWGAVGLLVAIVIIALALTVFRQAAV